MYEFPCNEIPFRNHLLTMRLSNTYRKSKSKLDGDEYMKYIPSLKKYVDILDCSRSNTETVWVKQSVRQHFQCLTSVR